MCGWNALGCVLNLEIKGALIPKIIEKNTVNLCGLIYSGNSTCNKIKEAIGVCTNHTFPGCHESFIEAATFLSGHSSDRESTVMKTGRASKLLAAAERGGAQWGGGKIKKKTVI